MLAAARGLGRRARASALAIAACFVSLAIAACFVSLAIAACFVSLAFGACASAQASPAEPWAATDADDLRPRIDTFGDRILVLGPAALYRLHVESETWTVTTAQSGLSAGDLIGMVIVGDELWVCGDGVCHSDARFDDWRCYGAAEGYPGQRVFDVEADDDYAYAATDAGAARFDRYVLEWEEVAPPAERGLGAVADVAVGEDRVWLGLDGGVAEYRKETESFRVDATLGQLQSPRVLALRQSSSHVWAFTSAGIARYDKDLETWTSYGAGVDLPDARVHQIELLGNDVWLGTDAGLWYYNDSQGIWREIEYAEGMPGQRVRAFLIEQDRTWVVTEQAFALYDDEETRWLDFTRSVPLAPAETRRIAMASGALVLLGEQDIVYGLSQAEDNPALFVYRSHPIVQSEATESRGPSWSAGLDASGLGITAPSGESAHVTGGVTVYVESEPTSDGSLDEFAHETRIDLSLSGRLRGGRTISGFYDNTDPDNEAYQISYRGTREDVIRNVSAGEIDQEIFNTNLQPDVGLRGGWIRAELGPRSETTRRRLATADVWAGERRTYPGRAVFFGNSKEASGTVRDVDYLQRMVFAVPERWSSATAVSARLFRDDGQTSTDDANTWHGTLAAREGSWDRLVPHRDYLPGPDGRSYLLTKPLGPAETLVAVADGAGNGDEVDLTGAWLRNRYWIAREPLPGSLSIVIRDSLGSETAADGRTFLEVFGLDEDGDGHLDPDRFSALSGLLSFPDSLPFPEEVYAEEPASIYTIAFSYQSRTTVFQLEHRNLLPGSEEIVVDRERLQAGADYTLIPSTGLFVIFEHVLLDEDSIIEVTYEYEEEEASDAPGVYAAQLGVAPTDFAFIGSNVTRWENDAGEDVRTLGLNARLEWKSERTFLRVMPEISLSDADRGSIEDPAAGLGANDGLEQGRPERPGNAESGSADAWLREATDRATAVTVQARYGNLEAAASYRNLGAAFETMEDRRTLLGRLREEARADLRLTLGRYWQTEVAWQRSNSDSVAPEAGLSAAAGEASLSPSAGNAEASLSPSAGNAEASLSPSAGNAEASLSPSAGDDSVGSGGHGYESSFLATLRFRRNGLPNVAITRGLVTIETPGGTREKLITRGELELTPTAEQLRPLRMKRLWIRTFLQRSERETRLDQPGTSGGELTTQPAASDGGSGDGSSERTTDHGYLRVNGSYGNPLSWNATFEDRRTFRPEGGGLSSQDLRRFQRLEATLQTRPHGSLDSYVRWESERDLFWGTQGGGAGFATSREVQSSTQLYPGRLWARLAPVSLRLDLSTHEAEVGEPGDPPPGGSSHFQVVDDAPARSRARTAVLETRLQITAWMRFVERWERSTGRELREALPYETYERIFDHRLELRPRGGLVTLRWRTERDEADLELLERSRRFLGEWDHTWGGGLLTYISLEARRTDAEEGFEGDRTDVFSPRARVTLRRSEMNLDANLGFAYTLTRTEDIAIASTGANAEQRSYTLTSSCNLQPTNVLGLKVQYAYTRSQPASPGGDAPWSGEHDLRLRVSVRM